MNQIETGLTWLAPFFNKILVFLWWIIATVFRSWYYNKGIKKLPVIGLQVAVVFGTHKAALVTE